MTNNQAILFLIFILNGILIGLLFDFFRILRRSFKTKDFITYLEDILFWILTGLIILYSIFTFNNGQIRLFIFLGLILGVSIYILTISRYVMKISITIISLFKKIIHFIINILSYPYNFIHKILKKIVIRPALFIANNLKKSFNKLARKINILGKNMKFNVENLKNSKNNIKN